MDSSGPVYCEAKKRKPLLLIVFLAVFLVSLAYFYQPGETPAEGGDGAVSTVSPGDVRVNPNLSARIVGDIVFDKPVYRAGDKVMATMVIENTGTERITKEKIKIRATARKLDDFVANLALKTMSVEKKSQDYEMEFSEVVEPGNISEIGPVVFHTQAKMNGVPLAGEYNIQLTLYVNGQWAETRNIDFRLNP